MDISTLPKNELAWHSLFGRQRFRHLCGSRRQEESPSIRNARKPRGVGYAQDHKKPQ
jgi:hypothetical protein